MVRLVVFALLGAAAFGQPQPTELFLRGRSVIPTPQAATLGQRDVELSAEWVVDGPPGIATRWLLDDLAALHRLSLKPGSSPANAIRLRIQAGTVSQGSEEVRPQSYRLQVAPGLIEVTGNAEPGLFYGVQTLLQLLKRDPRGLLTAPECSMEDWPRLPLRFLHWDSKHHQDRIETLKRYLDWAARFKVNMIGFELEDKFAYPSHPVIGAPGAFTPAQMQEIVDYGLERFIQVVPVVQSPAHMAYVLKHPAYAHLKADGNNYQSCLCLEETYKLIFRMYDDLIEATRGVDYFFVSTDEVYYAGIGANCKEPYNEANRSARWAEFARRAHDHLAAKGRRMLAWLEYPLLATDLEKIPAGVIDGVVGDDSFVPVERSKGMRQLVYTSTQGAEFLFPDHLPVENMPAGAGLGEFESVFTAGRLQSMFRSIPEARALSMNPIGLFAAAWDDSGLHNETFWLGWTAAARWGWRPGVPSAEQHAAEFMHVYYGPNSGGLLEVYRGVQRQARAWQRTWDRVISKTRPPGYGNSDGKGIGTARHDLTLQAPPLPAPADLAFQPAFATRNRSWVKEAASQGLENSRLQLAIHTEILRAERNTYNLEVLLALARFTGHHWQLIGGLAEVERSLALASAAAKQKRPAEAVGRLVEAHNNVLRLQRDGATIWADLTAVFEKSRLPKGLAVGDLKFVHVLDDTKDHWADRTADLGFMAAPERSIGLPTWLDRLAKVTRDYAARHRVPVAGLAEARLEE